MDEETLEQYYVQGAPLEELAAQAPDVEYIADLPFLRALRELDRRRENEEVA